MHDITMANIEMRISDMLTWVEQLLPPAPPGLGDAEEVIAANVCTNSCSPSCPS